MLLQYYLIYIIMECRIMGGGSAGDEGPMECPIMGGGSMLLGDGPV